MTKTAGISKGMAKWIEDFVVGLNKKAENEQIDTNTTPTETQTVEQTTPCDPSADPSTAEYFNGNKIASINVNDLPKVVWNDETFYVLFNEDNGSATILNKFTNVVTTVRASNIEEVDEALNSLQVVTSNNDNLNLKTAKEISEELMEEVDNHELEYDIIYQTYVDGILDIHPDLDWMKDRIKNSILYYQCYDIDKVNIIKVNYYKEYGNNSKRSS